MKLGKKLSLSQFIIAHLLLFIIGLAFLAGLYYILNLQYTKPNKPFLAGPITSPPKSLRLDLDQPDDESISYNSQITVSGKAGPQKTVLISTPTTDIVTGSKTDGSFSAILELEEGINKITITAFDSLGESKSEQRTVYYSEGKI